MKGRSVLGRCLAAVALVWAAQAAQATLTEDLNNISIQYKPFCDAATQNLNLGNLHVELEDPVTLDYSHMEATFTVSNAAKATHIFDCMELHYLQVIWGDDCPAEYFGTARGDTYANRVIDPPKDGWDYMYTNPGARTGPMNAGPNFKYFLDDQPWYYAPAGEAAKFTLGNSYSISDDPVYCTGNHDNNGDGLEDTTRFSTYLVATAKQTCSDNADCLKKNEIFLLAGWDWDVSDTGNTLNAPFIPSATGFDDVAFVKGALSTAGFSGWTSRETATICCPEPGTWALLLIGCSGLVRRRRRLGAAA